LLLLGDLQALHLVWGESSNVACVPFRGSLEKLVPRQWQLFLNHESTRQKKALNQRGSGLALLLLGDLQALHLVWGESSNVACVLFRQT
jgi:hypothetical protein